LPVLCLPVFAPAARGGEKYLWAELIVFDNAAADHGVGEYLSLSRMTVKPRGVSLLLTDLFRCFHAVRIVPPEGVRGRPKAGLLCRFAS